MTGPPDVRKEAVGAPFRENSQISSSNDRNTYRNADGKWIRVNGSNYRALTPADKKRRGTMATSHALDNFGRPCPATFVDLTPQQVRQARVEADRRRAALTVCDDPLGGGK